MRIKLDCKVTLNEIANAISADFSEIGERVITHIVTDSRLAKGGDLFFALRGERFNGEQFVEEAIKRGAFAVSTKVGNGILSVESAENALLGAAALYKSKLPMLKATVAITGSVGKTTTKEFLKSILSIKYQTHATHENENNGIGVPYTILSAPRETEMLICEMGMNHAGEISSLSKCVKPDIGIITNIGSAHIGNLGSRENIARAKLEILDGMMGGALIVPLEERLTNEVYGRKTVSLSSKEANAFITVKEETERGTLFDYSSDFHTIRNIFIRIPGPHVPACLVNAIYAAEMLGVDSHDIFAEISLISDKNIRQNFINAGNFTICDDTYSSSPEALRAAIAMTKAVSKGNFSLLLGDMLELGKESARLHEEAGAYSAKCGAHRIYLIGDFAGNIADGAIRAGMDKELIFINSDKENPELTAKQILDHHAAGEIILFKASHALHLDRVIRIIKNFMGG